MQKKPFRENGNFKDTLFYVIHFHFHQLRFKFLVLVYLLKIEFCIVVFLIFIKSDKNKQITRENIYFLTKNFQKSISEEKHLLSV